MPMIDEPAWKDVGMEDFFAKVKVVLKAAPTYLALAITVITVMVGELVPLLPEDLAVRVTAFAVALIAALAAVIRTIRRLTPVPKEQRGLLPPPKFGP